MQNLKKKLYFGLIGLFFAIQILSFLLLHYLIFQIYLYDIYYDVNWGYGVFTMSFLGFFSYLFTFILEMILNKEEKKSKLVFIGCLFPFLIWFNYESAFWALTCGTISLLITLFWYYLLYVNHKK
jgi:hypothetical protein